MEKNAKIFYKEWKRLLLFFIMPVGQQKKGVLIQYIIQQITLIAQYKNVDKDRFSARTCTSDVHIINTTKKNVPFFYKERKRTQRSFRSFIKNGKERKDPSVLL